MSNTSTVAGVAFSGTARNSFPTQAIAAVGPTILTVNTDTGTTPYFLVAPTGGQVLGATGGVDVNANQAITERSSMVYGLPSGESNDQFSASSWDGRLMKVRIAGVGNAGANAGQLLTVNLYQGTSTTPSSNNVIGATGAAFAAVAGGAFNFYIEATIQWDATSQILTGSYTGNIAFGATKQFVAPTAFTSVTGVTAANLSFSAALTLGSATASTLTVREFVLDRV